MKKLGFVTLMLLAGLMTPGQVAATMEPKIALLDSSASTYAWFQQNFATCDGGNYLGGYEYKRYFLGWKYVLDGNRYVSSSTGDAFSPYDYQTINDTAITDGSLDSFSILILSNDAALSADQMQAVQTWVQNGGKLIATYGTGYDDIVFNTSGPSYFSVADNGMDGLHNLWGDPFSKAFGTNLLTPDPYVNITVTNPSGPTDIFAPNTVLWYGGQANLLVQRPANDRDMLAVLNLTVDGLPDTLTGDVAGLEPAVLNATFSKGQVIYFSFAPEFIVSLAYDLAGHCSGDGNYPAADPSAPPSAPGPNADVFPNAFCYGSGLGGTPPCARPAPLIDLMKRTIDYMATGQ